MLFILNTKAEWLEVSQILLASAFIPMHPYYKQLGYKIEEYPNAQEAYNGAVSLPLYPKMTDEQVNRVIEVVLELANTLKK
jgi:dTDP-4-amino-4,6-dideoxygalactose transaminase